MNLQTRFPAAPDPLAAHLAIISLLFSYGSPKAKGRGSPHCQGAPLIRYVSQGYGASRLTGPWRHKPRPPWRLSANPDAWHGPCRPMGAGQEPWMAMICSPPRAISIMWNFDGWKECVFLWGLTEVERVELPPLSRGAPDGSSSEQESQWNAKQNANKMLGKLIFTIKHFNQSHNQLISWIFAALNV